MTANAAADKALLRPFSLFGPAAMLIMRPDGHELESHPVIGFQEAAAFMRHLSSLSSAVTDARH